MEKNIEQACELCPNFKRALELRSEIDRLSPFQVAQKVQMADSAIDELAKSQAALICKVYGG